MAPAHPGSPGLEPVFALVDRLRQFQMPVLDVYVRISESVLEMPTAPHDPRATRKQSFSLGYSSPLFSLNLDSFFSYHRFCVLLCSHFINPAIAGILGT